ncbi:MAG TPA: septum formation initiator family protein [Actinomycetota bacterium]
MSASATSPAVERNARPSPPVTGVTRGANRAPRRAPGRHEVARGHVSTPRLTARAAVLCVVVLFMLTLAVAPLRGLIDQRAQLTRLERRADVLAERNAELEEHIGRLNDPIYLERVARQCLGMVRPGETAFVMVPAHGALPSPEC